MKLNHKLIAGMMILSAGASLAACSNSNTIATYKGGKVTQEDYYNRIKATSASKQVLGTMLLTDALQSQYGNSSTDRQVNKMYNRYKDQYGSQFKQMLAQSGMTASSLRDNIKLQILGQKALHSIKKVSASDEKQAWENYQPKVQVQHILVKNKATAEKIISQLQHGANFDSLAKKYSQDMQTKNNGGKLPAFDSYGQYDQQFKDAAFKLKQGKFTTTPVKSAYGYHVIKAIKVSPKGTFAEHKSEIDNQLYAQMEQNQNTMREVFAKVVKKADVKISDKDLKGALDNFTKPQPQQGMQMQGGQQGGQVVAGGQQGSSQGQVVAGN